MPGGWSPIQCLSPRRSVERYASTERYVSVVCQSSGLSCTTYTHVDTRWYCFHCLISNKLPSHDDLNLIRRHTGSLFGIEWIAYLIHIANRCILALQKHTQCQVVSNSSCGMDRIDALLNRRQINHHNHPIGADPTSPLRQGIRILLRLFKPLRTLATEVPFHCLGLSRLQRGNRTCHGQLEFNQKTIHPF